jgi:hypothetical protein
MAIFGKNAPNPRSKFRYTKQLRAAPEDGQPWPSSAESGHLRQKPWENRHKQRLRHASEPDSKLLCALTQTRANCFCSCTVLPSRQEAATVSSGPEMTFPVHPVRERRRSLRL